MGSEPQKMHFRATRYLPIVSESKQQPAATQKTPKGYEIPVPTRDQVLGFFKKVARPKKG
jgi:hypothetical protein